MELTKQYREETNGRPYRTKQNRNELEFKTAYKESELGMIKGWEHIIAICNACIKAHKEELTDEHINQVWDFNKHKYGSTEPK